MVRASDPKLIVRCREIMKVARALPVEARLARLKASGIVDEQGQVIVDDSELQGNGKKSNGPTFKKKKPVANKSSNGKSTNGKHS